jgi:hypothetical protein
MAAEPDLVAEDEIEETDDSVPTLSDSNLSDKQIENLYEKGRFRVLQERNDFMLPQVLDYVKKNRWINTRPEYQRRLRWDNKKKSQLIESFIMNIPVPPIFLFENELNQYEVMDGQQRLNAITEFYNNEFKLSGLKVWGRIARSYICDAASKAKARFGSREDIIRDIDLGSWGNGDSARGYSFTCVRKVEYRWRKAECSRAS